MGIGRDSEPMGLPNKKLKTVVDSDDNNTGDCQTDTETNTIPNTSEDDLDRNTQPPSWLNDDIHKGPIRGTLRPLRDLL